MLIGTIEGATRVCGKRQGFLGLPLRDVLVNCSVSGPNTPAMITAWQPTPDELKALSLGASVHVLVHGQVPPPMNVSVGPLPDDVPHEEVEIG